MSSYLIGCIITFIACVITAFIKLKKIQVKHIVGAAIIASFSWAALALVILIKLIVMASKHKLWDKTLFQC